MTTPRWTRRLLARLAPDGRADDVIGDLEEAHRARSNRHTALLATLLTVLDALDMAFALLRGRVRGPARDARRSQRPTPPGNRITRGPSFSWLDFKLGFRMLLKYPVLTFVGGLAMAFSIWTGASFFELISQAIHPRLNLPNGDRIVGIRVWDSEANGVEDQTLADFLVWRGEVRTIDHLGAFTSSQRNLVTDGGFGAPELVGEMSASGFAVAGVAPLMGRVLLDSDEDAAAPPVVVIGHRLWKERFASDPQIVGRSVTLGGTVASIVGVMPEGFEWPVAHDLWTPLKANYIARGYAGGPEPTALARMSLGSRGGPGIKVFGRLGVGFTQEDAQREMTALGERAAADSPETHAHLLPQVVPYAASILQMPSLVGLGLASSNLLLVLLLVLVCGNVALLMFARAATRESEIIVRNALGAGRRRIVIQLFSEALVLGTVSAAIGLACAGYGLRWVLTIVESQAGQSGIRLPFWFTAHLSWPTILYACALTLLAAVIAGVGPALRITGKEVASQLRQTGGGGKSAKFSGVWTLVIVSQVAVTVAFPATAYFVRKDMREVGAYDFGFDAQEYATVRLEMDQKPLPDGTEEPDEQLKARFATSVADLQVRLAADPQVSGVTITTQLPLQYHPWMQIELDEGAVAPPDERGHRIGAANVGIDYFDVLDGEILSGRGFDAGDLEANSKVVVVSEPFVRAVLGGKNPVGRRLRYVGEGETEASPEDWFEIVGVVEDLGIVNGYGTKGVYHPTSAERAYPVYLVVHVRGEASSFSAQLRRVAADVDPTIRLHAMMPLSNVAFDEVQFYEFWFKLSVMVSAVALLLSLACIYAVMAFTVSRRTREIGIRVALGSDSRRVALAIFKRPLIQVACGIALGMVWTTLLSGSFGVSFDSQKPVDLSLRGAALVAAYAVLMVGVCLLACIVPTRRALRIQPTDALRAEG